MKSEAVSLSDGAMPQNIEAENALIGELLIDRSVIDAVALILRPDDFYQSKASVVYDAILKLNNDGVIPDIVSVLDYLRKNDDDEMVGGATGLMMYTTDCTSGANAEYHACLIKEKALLRGVVAAGYAMVRDGIAGTAPATDLVAQTMADLDILSGNAVHASAQTIKSMAGKMHEIIDIAHKTRKSDIGIRSNINCLDAMTAGFQPGKVYVIGAPTGVGKTTLMLNCLYAATMQYQKNVLVFSLEMSAEELIFRLISMHTMIPHRTIEHGQMGQDEWGKYTMRSEIWDNDRLFIVDDCNLSVEDIMATSRRMQREHEIHMIAVDYIQLARWAGNGGTDRYLQVTAQARTMKRMSRQLKVPVIIVTQLNDDGRTRESRDIENDSDFFMTIEEPDVDAIDTAFPIRGIVRKNRSGPKERMNLVFNKPIQRFYDNKTGGF